MLKNSVIYILASLCFHILKVICSVYILDLRQMGGGGEVHYTQDVDSDRVTLDCIMRDGLKKGVHYKQEMRLLQQEYTYTGGRCT